MKAIKIKTMFDNIPENYTGIVEFSDGSKRWYLNGKLHRTDGPAIEYPDGTKHWFLNGQLHRTDGPAVVWDDGTKEWLLNGKHHRENGPAIEFSDGEKRWYLNGRWLDENKINQFVDEFDYPIEVTIKLTYLLEINES